MYVVDVRIVDSTDSACVGYEAWRENASQQCSILSGRLEIQCIPKSGQAPFLLASPVADMSVSVRCMAICCALTSQVIQEVFPSFTL